MTAVETRERTRLLAGEKLKRRVALVTGSTRATGRSLASQRGRSVRSDEVARVADFLCADACAVMTGRVLAVTGSRGM
jgi:NAD(P)-dependent dehydrogenase (short-subunit alcohol dehydrogenase family)